MEHVMPNAERKRLQAKWPGFWIAGLSHVEIESANVLSKSRFDKPVVV